uniref:PD-(D/E)XK nuclease domain-containing protein n=1 Tax=Haliangium sp. TaxID=2663208 RepID=UPI003D11B65F
HGGNLAKLTRSLLGGDAAGFEEQLQALALNLLSYHDAGHPDPESLYHCFLIGLLAVLEPGHRVRSNRESGKGRPDVMIAPAEAGRPGVLLELKVARPGVKSLDEAVAEGLTQIAAKDYDAELRALGAEPIHALAVAFDGKVVKVRAP